MDEGALLWVTFDLYLPFVGGWRKISVSVASSEFKEKNRPPEKYLEMQITMREDPPRQTVFLARMNPSRPYLVFALLVMRQSILFSMTVIEARFQGNILYNNNNLPVNE